MSFWETIAVGETAELGVHRFEADAIKRFAAAYDPQPFHLDEAAAAASVLGGLCASGWHTCAVFMRLNVEHQGERVRQWTAAGGEAPELGPSPGVRNIRWLRPVFAGDVIRYRQSVTAKRLLETRPGWGIAETYVEAFNQRDEMVFSMDGAAFVATR